MQNYPFIHSADCTNPADNLELLCAHDHPAQEVEWLWPGKIPIGKVSMIIGDPGTGKTLLALDIAARASRGGGTWPDDKLATAGQAIHDDTRQGDKETGRQGESSSNPSRSLSPCLPVSPSFPPTLPVSPASTLILSATDDFQDTLRPRLDAAGADPRRIFFIPSITDLRHDIAQLRAAVDRAPNVRLIIIDPINAFVGPTDSHFHSVLRRVLEPLAKLAAEKRIAVIAIAHLRKNDGAAIHRAAGSMGFVAAARSVWSLARDEEHPGRTQFLPVKNNLIASATGLAFTIESHAGTGDPTIAWDPTPIAAPDTPRTGERIELNTARNWLSTALAHGPCSASELAQEAAQFGIHERTLRRALHALGGQTQNRGLLDGWWWSLPATEGHTAANPAFAASCDFQPAGTPRAEFDDLPPTPSPQPPAPEIPVPFCPLPEIFNDPAFAPLPLGPVSIDESIRAIGRFDQWRRDLGNGDSARNPQPPPSNTGNAVLDEILDSIRANRSRLLSGIPAPPQIFDDSSASQNGWDSSGANAPDSSLFAATSPFTPAPLHMPPRTTNDRQLTT